MNKKAFTLIELIATIVILVILATIAIPAMIDRIDYFNEKAFETMISSIESATISYVNDNRENLEELDKFGFINVKINDLMNSGHLEGNIINPQTDEPISIDDIIYVTLDYKNKIEVKYDVFQKENPRITLNGPKTLKIKKGTAYVELGALAISPTGTNISASVVIQNAVNTALEGVYVLKYSVPNSIVIERYIVVTSDFPKDDIEKPLLSSNVSNNYIETTLGVAITLPIVTATDNINGVVSPISPTSNNVNITATGTYYIKYNYTDTAGNKADTLNVKVVVKP